MRRMYSDSQIRRIANADRHLYSYRGDFSDYIFGSEYVGENINNRYYTFITDLELETIMDLPVGVEFQCLTGALNYQDEEVQVQTIKRAAEGNSFYVHLCNDDGSYFVVPEITQGNHFDKTVIY